jgi:hypothetical protein
MKDIKKSFSSIGYEFKDGQKYFKKLELTYTDRERRIMKKMKNITSSDLWSWSSDMDNIQDLVCDTVHKTVYNLVANSVSDSVIYSVSDSVWGSIYYSIHTSVRIPVSNLVNDSILFS